MAAIGTSSCLIVGPVPFKDVAAAANISRPAEDYCWEDIISTLPSITDDTGLRQYQGVWLQEQTVPGVLSVQRRFTPRPDDVLLASPPKCGTTWLKALCFAIMGRAAYPPSAADHPLLRLNPHDCVPFVEDVFGGAEEAKVEALPSPRLMHTHMHHSMLPHGCKIIYVCREPKDMVVSLWHFVRDAMPAGDMCALSELLERASEGKHAYGPIWDHNLGYWSASKASPESVMFLRYEKLLADPAGSIREMARFLGLPFTAAEEAAGSPSDIANLCSIDTMRGLDVNKAGAGHAITTPSYWGEGFVFPHQSFFRKGVAGDWVNHMTPETARRFDAIVEDKLRGSGLTFTY